MPRCSPKSLALFVFAFCVLWQTAGNGIATAEAGCGDYVHLGQMQSAGHANGIADAVARHLSSRNSRGPNQELPRQPCQGPHCRPQPLMPLTPVPPASTPQQKACLLEQVVPMLAVSQALILDGAARHDELPGSPLERPPRNCS